MPPPDFPVAAAAAATGDVMPASRPDRARPATGNALRRLRRVLVLLPRPDTVGAEDAVVKQQSMAHTLGMRLDRGLRLMAGRLDGPAAAGFCIARRRALVASVARPRSSASSMSLRSSSSAWTGQPRLARRCRRSSRALRGRQAIPRGVRCVCQAVARRHDARPAAPPPREKREASDIQSKRRRRPFRRRTAHRGHPCSCRAPARVSIRSV